MNMKCAEDFPILVFDTLGIKTLVFETKSKVCGKG
jgi:hypothetical protein